MELRMYEEFSMVDDNYDVTRTMPINTVDCPHCNYRIPVKKEFTDYKTMYDEMKKQAQYWKDKITIYFELEENNIKYYEKLTKDYWDEVKRISLNRKGNYDYLHEKIDRMHKKIEVLRKERDTLCLFMDIDLDKLSTN